VFCVVHLKWIGLHKNQIIDCSDALFIYLHVLILSMIYTSCMGVIEIAFKDVLHKSQTMRKRRTSHDNNCATEEYIKPLHKHVYKCILQARRND